MNDHAEDASDFHLAACKVRAMLPVFLHHVREADFGMPWRATAIVALGEQGIGLLSQAIKAEARLFAPYIEAGQKVMSILWGIGEQLQDLQGDEAMSDLCWGMLDGMREILKSAGLEPDDNANEETNAAEQERRRHLATRAGCEISDIATALTKLMDSDKTAELTLIRRIESLSGVVLSAANEDHKDFEELEGMLAGS